MLSEGLSTVGQGPQMKEDFSRCPYLDSVMDRGREGKREDLGQRMVYTLTRSFEFKMVKPKRRWKEVCSCWM